MSSSEGFRCKNIGSQGFSTDAEGHFVMIDMFWLAFNFLDIELGNCANGKSLSGKHIGRLRDKFGSKTPDFQFHYSANQILN